MVSLLSSQGSGRRPLRIARWSERLLRYNYTVEYRKSSKNQVADALSRLPVSVSQEDDSFNEEVVSLVAPLCLTKEQFQESLREDATLEQVKAYVASSWPSYKSIPDALQPFFAVREELSVVDDLLLRGERLVVPPFLTSQVISTAHEAHPGIVRTKARLRERFWWPGMDKQGEVAIHNCIVCQAADKSAKTAVTPLQPVPLPERPWKKVAVDIVGPMERALHDFRFAITLVDYFSKWPEVQFCSEVSMRTVTIFLLSVFSREGYPDEIVCDNGPQFCSREFNQFLKERAIRLSHSSVYYPQAYGLVERFNRVFKNFVQTALLEHRPLRQAVIEYLGIYRCTPHATTGVAPALLLHRRLPRTRLDVVGHPSSSFFKDPATELRRLRRRVKHKQETSKRQTDFRRAAKKTNIAVGDFVGVRKPSVAFKGDPSFGSPHKVLEQRGQSSFRLDDGRTWNASKLAKVPSGPRTLRPEETWNSQDASTLRSPSPGNHGLPAAREASQAAAASLPAPVATRAALDPGTPEPQAGVPLPALVADRAAPDLDPPELQPGPAPRRVQPPRARQAPKRYDDYV